MSLKAPRAPQIEAEPEPKLLLERAEEDLPPPDPSDIEPELKTMPYVPGTGSKFASTIPPASRVGKETASRARTNTALNRTLARARSGLQRAYRSGASFVEGRRAKLPSSLRKKLERMPTSALLGIGVAVPCFALGAVVVGLTLSPGSEAEPRRIEPNEVKLDVNAAAPSEPPTEPTTEHTSPVVANDISKPAAPLVAASASTADEATVLLDLADSLGAQHRDVEAIAVLDRLLLRRPELRSDARVAKVLMQTVYSDDRPAREGSFALLEGPMAEDGATLMYQLSRSRDVRDGPRRHAETWLKSRAFDRVAALPLYTLVKLRYAKTCEEKRALLGLASAGGRETLDYLRELEARTTCAPDDLDHCYPCLRADSRLAETIATLEKRLGS